MDPIQLSTFHAPRGQDAGGRYIAADLQEIEVITAGRGFFELDGRLLTALRGAMLWHLPGERTIYRNDFRDPYECLVVKFPWPGPASASGRPAPRFSRWSDPNACIEFTEELMRYYHGQDPDLALLAAYAYGILVWQAHRGSIEGEERPPSSPVGAARVFIEKNFDKNLTIADLADSAAVSAPHLHSLFRRELGVTPHQVLLDRRLTEARRLLAGSRLSVKEIAFKTGFTEAAALCKCFKARCGCTPLEYRERHTQKDGF
jgi:AraC-like DNA-binding protein